MRVGVWSGGRATESRDAGDDGVAPRTGSFGSDGADADADKAAGGEVLEGVVGAGADSGGAALPEGGTAGIGYREGLHFITPAVGDDPPAGADFAGEGGLLHPELDRSGQHLRRGGRTAQTPAGTEQGLVAGIGTLTGAGGIADQVAGGDEFGFEDGGEGAGLLVEQIPAINQADQFLLLGAEGLDGEPPMPV